MIELFDFQKTLVGDFNDALDKGFRRPLIVCPTGGGKTVVARTSSNNGSGTIRLSCSLRTAMNCCFRRETS